MNSLSKKLAGAALSALLLALAAVLADERPKITPGRRLLHSLAIALLGSATVIILFFISEEEMTKSEGVRELIGMEIKRNCYNIKKNLVPVTFAFVAPFAD